MRHPSVAKPRRKEIHYFDLYYWRGPSWYRRQFRRFPSRKHRITGEASPYYLFHPAVPERVAETCPDARFVVLLRDPVRRAYSHYQLIRQRDWEPLSFEDAIREEEARLAGEPEKLQDPRYWSFAHLHQSYVARGIYVDQLRAWFAHFQREQFLVLRSEDFYESPATGFRRTLDFLGLPPIELGQYRQENVGQYDSQMKPETYAQLRAFYKPHNERLYELLQTDFGWDD